MFTTPGLIGDWQSSTFKASLGLLTQYQTANSKVKLIIHVVMRQCSNLHIVLICQNFAFADQVAVILKFFIEFSFSITSGTQSYKKSNPHTVGITDLEYIF